MKEHTNGMHPRLARFEREFKDIDLANYYQLKVNLDENESIHIKKDIHPDSILLTLRYERKDPCPLFDLPDELNRIIASYLHSHIEIQSKIEYSTNYPFVPPIWYMKGLVHNIPNHVCLVDYYTRKIDQHNRIYNLRVLGVHQWSPAISIEKDILLFLLKVNHFQEMLADPILIK